MKFLSILLFAIICINGYVFALTDTLFLQESEETWFVTVRPKTGQSALDIAKEYNTPPNLLLNYNNIDADKIFSEIEYVDIPLNEVNFYRNYSINPQEKEFLPLFYKTKKGEDLGRICAVHEINKLVLKKWNPNLSDYITENTVLLVGWLKVGNPALIENFSFSTNNKILKLDAELYEEEPLKTEEPTSKIITNAKTNVEIQNKSTTETNDNETNIENTSTNSNEKLNDFKEKISKLLAKKKTENITTKTTSTTAKEIIKPNATIVKKQEEPVAKKEVTTTNSNKSYKKDMQYAIKRGGKTTTPRKNLSYKKDMQYAIKSNPKPTTVPAAQPTTQAKNNTITKSQNPSTNNISKKIKNILNTKKEKEILTEKTEEKTIKSETTLIAQEKITEEKNENFGDDYLYEDTSTTPIYTSTQTTKPNLPKPTVAEEKISTTPISQGKTAEGNCGFLYSGNNSGQYYAFTNLASKGSIITVTYQGNSLRAKIMGTLDNNEQKQGFVIMLSDNAKRALKAKNNSLKVTIDY